MSATFHPGLIIKRGDYNACLNLSQSLSAALSMSDADRLARYGTEGCRIMACRLTEILEQYHRQEALHV